MKQRELKFRAWNGKYMIDPGYGDWVSFDGVPYTESSQKFDTPNIEIQKVKDYTLMQFTGLLDKNGKEIYEGDIVQGNVHAPNGTPVTFENGSFMWRGEPLCWDFDSGEEPELCHPKRWATVTGNIYENPDLLTQ